MLEDEHRQLQYMLDIIQQEGLLSVVKLMCDWMKCNTGVITTCAQVIEYIQNYSQRSIRHHYQQSYS
jgi:hemerythrin-like domain-containing protein